MLLWSPTRHKTGLEWIEVQQQPQRAPVTCPSQLNPCSSELWHYANEKRVVSERRGDRIRMPRRKKMVSHCHCTDK